MAVNVYPLISPPRNRLRIAFTGSFWFPAGTAMARRVLGLARSLDALGHEVVVGSSQAEADMDRYALGPLPFSVHGLNDSPPANASHFAKGLATFTDGKKTLAWLREMDPPPDVVLLYLPGPGASSYLTKIVPWCHDQHIPVIADIVEWYQPSHLPGGRFGPIRWNVELAMSHHYLKVDSVIAISRYLEDYYTNRGCNVTRIPPTLDVFAIKPRLDGASEGPIRLVYAGKPGKKDLVGNVIESLLQLDAKGEYVRLTMAGPTPTSVLQMPPLRKRGLSKLPPCVEVLGQLPHAEVINLVRAADFVPLLRRPQRYAMAGFPTKVPEALSLGTPVICNLTSNLGDHIRDSETGFICEDFSTQAFSKVLQTVLEVSDQTRASMRAAARAEAEKAFDFRAYMIPLADMLCRLTSSG